MKGRNDVMLIKLYFFLQLLDIALNPECVCVKHLQVVCEKGLGVNGTSLTSLKEEGFKAVFVGIGEEIENQH